MECYVHPDQPAVGACVACGHFVCDYCRVNMQGKIYCKACLEQGATGPHQAPPRPGHAPYNQGAPMGAGGWKRSRTNKVFAGVCAGIAPELNMDPTLVRVLYCLLTLGTGLVLGLVAYIVLWQVLPEE